MKSSKKFTSLVRGKWIKTPGVRCVTCVFHMQDNCLQLRTTGSLGLWEGEVTKCMNSTGEEVGLWWWSSTKFRSGRWCKGFISGGGETKIFYCWMHWGCMGLENNYCIFSAPKVSIYGHVQSVGKFTLLQRILDPARQHPSQIMQINFKWKLYL